MSTKKQEAKELFNDANKLYEGQLYEEALEHYQKATKLDVTFYDAHFCVAKTQIRLKNFERGIKHFKKHIHLIPEENRVMYSVGLAGILMEENKEEKAFKLVKEQGDEVPAEQRSTFLRILLANGEVNLVLLHLLNIPREKAPELYQQIVNDESIKEVHRQKLQKEYAIPEYHTAIKKATLLSSAPVESTTYSKRADGVFRYIQQGKKDFGESFQLYIDTLNEKIMDVQQLLADRVQNNIERHNTSKAQSQSDALGKTEYDPVKLQKLRSSLAAVKKKKRNTYVKYGSVAVVCALVIFGAIELFGYINDRSSWKEAQSADNYEAYANYLSEHPNGSYADEARNLTEVRYWNTLKDTANPEAYDKYLDNFPNGKHELQALKKFNALSSGESQSTHSENTQTVHDDSKNDLRRAKVTGSDVIIRSDHTTESKVAGVVKQKGSEVRILDEYYPSNSGEAILKKDVSVYANNHSIVLHKGKAVSIISTGGSRVRVKFATEEEGSVTATINKSDLESISSKKWYKVRTEDNTTGWMYGKFIEEL